MANIRVLRVGPHLDFSQHSIRCPPPSLTHSASASQLTTENPDISRLQPRKQNCMRSPPTNSLVSFELDLKFVLFKQAFSMGSQEVGPVSARYQVFIRLSLHRFRMVSVCDIFASFQHTGCPSLPQNIANPQDPQCYLAHFVLGVISLL